MNAPGKMSDKSQSIEKKKFVTHEGRLSFPALSAPKLAPNAKEEKYSARILFPKDTDFSKPSKGQTISMKQAVYNAIEEKHGPDKSKWPKGLRMPFRDGDEKPDLEGYPGHMFITAMSKASRRPGVVGPDRAEILNIEEELYAGCYVKAQLIAFYYDTAGNKGVSFSLQNIQKTREGQPFTGRQNPTDVFEAVSDNTENDPASYGATTSGADDYDLGV